LHLVFVGAHPDDETSAGGTIAKYVDLGHEATIVVATRGGRGHWSTPPEELERVRHRARQRDLESGVTYAEAFISQHGRKRALDLFPRR
jgi:LmbE family N-acetylglucosaminyl deacetylase